VAPPGRLHHAARVHYDRPVPELPDIELYLHALRPRLLHRTIVGVRVAAPFLVRTIDPPVTALFGRAVTGLRRLGKRIVIDAGDISAVLHLMIAGRLRWLPSGAAIPKRIGLAAIDLESGTLVVTEAGSTRRASLHMAYGSAGVAALDPGGLEPLDLDLPSFAARLASERHTLKRSLTDPSLFSGIGNAYSDEILHQARLSPMRLSDALTPLELERLFGTYPRVLGHYARERGVLTLEDAVRARAPVRRHPHLPPRVA
jgi:formamidopyrimidine-DNA glycosylase